MAYSLIWLPDVLKAAGLKVIEVAGWQNRGRTEMGNVEGVMCHHTGNAKPGNMPTLLTLVNGRPDLAGPLSQLGLGRDGTYYIIAAGKANHAGAGKWKGIVTGNSSFIGIEAEHSGNPKDAWPFDQYTAYITGVAAILNYIGKPVEYCVGHKEYATPKGRKSDPTFDMVAFRNSLSIKIYSMSTQSVYLKLGATGYMVKKLQKKLSLVPDGNFGPATEAAVKAIQQKSGIVVDGIVGPDTWHVIKNL